MFPDAIEPSKRARHSGSGRCPGALFHEAQSGNGMRKVKRPKS